MAVQISFEGTEADVGYGEHWVPRSGYGIYAREYPGEGSAVVLMHGFPDNLHLYDRVVPHLVSAGRRVVVFDFLGWGNSDKPRGFPYAADNQARDLAAVFQHLGLEKIVPVAHDASGATGHRLGVVASRADRCSRLAEHLLRAHARRAAAGGDLPVLHARLKERGAGWSRTASTSSADCTDVRSVVGSSVTKGCAESSCRSFTGSSPRIPARRRPSSRSTRTSGGGEVPLGSGGRDAVVLPSGEDNLWRVRPLPERGNGPSFPRPLPELGAVPAAHRRGTSRSSTSRKRSPT
jgi:hypothetical protein